MPIKTTEKGVSKMSDEIKNNEMTTQDASQLSPEVAAPQNGGAEQGKKRFRARSPLATFKRILGYLKGYKLQLFFAIICIFANVLCNIGGTFMMSIIINNYILPLSGFDPASYPAELACLGGLTGLDAFFAIMGVMASIYVVGAVLHYVYNIIIVRITSKVLQCVRDEMFERLQTLPIKYFDTHTHGDLMSLFTNDTDTLRELLSNGLPNLITQALTIVGMFIMMMILNWVLTLVSIVMLVI